MCPTNEVVKQLGATVEPYMKRMGFLPNALKLYAHRPEIAETLFRLNSNIMRDPSSTLDQFLKRKLSAVASRTNGCTYCTAHCCSMLIKSSSLGPEGWGLNESEVHDLLSGDYQPKDELERACIDFVVAASTEAVQRPRRDPRAAQAAPHPAPDRRAGLRGRVLEVLQHGPRQPAHPPRVEPAAGLGLG